jgi:hypothetical protein
LIGSWEPATVRSSQPRGRAVLRTAVSRNADGAWCDGALPREAQPPGRAASRRSTYGAGRPFFMVIGINHASAAPAPSKLVSTPGQSRGYKIVNVGLDQYGPPPAGRPLGQRRAHRFSTRVTLGRPTVSRLPAPAPAACSVSMEDPSQRSARTDSNAIPGGVVCSPDPPEKILQPVASSTTAGTGTPRSP